MVRTTLKEIKEHYGKDITNYSKEELNQLIQEVGELVIIAYSLGVYGWNGLLAYNSKVNKYYKVTSRSTALFMLWWGIKNDKKRTILLQFI